MLYVAGDRGPARLAPLAISLDHAIGHAHDAVDQLRAFEVAWLVEGCEDLGGELACLVEHLAH